MFRECTYYKVMLSKAFILQNFSMPQENNIISALFISGIGIKSKEDFVFQKDLKSDF